jgi:integrase
MAAELNKTTVDALACPPGRRDMLVFDAKLPGFAIRVTETGTKTFILQYKRGGRTRRIVIGRYGIVTPTQARNKALELLGELAKGVDPLAAREAAIAAEGAAKAAQERIEAARREAEAFTCAVLVKRWQEIALAERSEAYRREAPRALLNLLGELQHEPVAALLTSSLQILVDAAIERTPVHTINARSYGRAAWNWARRRGLVNFNPFAEVAIEKRVKARDRVLLDTEIGEVWKQAGQQSYPFGPIIKMLLLTLQRRNEVAGMRWSEISHDLTIWTLPADRAKNGRAHVVHLVAAAREILIDARLHTEEMVRKARSEGHEVDESDYVFTTTGVGPAVNVQKGRRTLERKIAKEREKEAEDARRAFPALNWRLHDFRRTGVTKLAQIGIAPHVADRILNHVSGSISGVAAVYQKFEFLPERKQALEIWAKHVLAAANGNTTKADVIDLAARRRGSLRGNKTGD